ncbi:DUF86 domain-containing protein [Neorhizobium sp. NCHU2750]|uniref:HepT-like ribonuclease domain-containing protein n=1 Tax=Neorhizobium sp. NCHU2750 TaxID=1825976 RepID=UPI000E73C2AD|nr:hypothetical protein NCHU2750_24930 [Neorhizobium sp. NCHU2750]
MKDRTRLYLHQMHSAGADACRFVQGMDREAFLDNLLVQRGVGMSILMLGEAVVRMARENPEFLADHPEVPWSQIQGLRNRIAHGYFEIDLGIVWETVQVAIPEFLEKLQTVVDWHAQGE